MGVPRMGNTAALSCRRTLTSLEYKSRTAAAPARLVPVSLEPESHASQAFRRLDHEPNRYVSTRRFGNPLFFTSTASPKPGQYSLYDLLRTSGRCRTSLLTMADGLSVEHRQGTSQNAYQSTISRFCTQRKRTGRSENVHLSHLPLQVRARPAVEEVALRRGALPQG